MKHPASKKTRIQTAGHTLVVVDVQEGYLSNPKLRKPDEIKSRVKATVKRYSDRGDPVLFVEWPTAGGIPRDVLKAAKNRKVVRKHQMDGSMKVFCTIKDLGWPENIHICGGFIGQCLYETVMGLRAMHKKTLTVVADACYDTKDSYGFACFDGVKRVMVV